MNSLGRRIFSLKLGPIVALFGLLVARDPALGQSSDSLKYFPCDVGDTWFYFVQYSPYEAQYKTIRIDSAAGHPMGKLLYMSGDEYRSSWIVMDTSKGIVYDAGLITTDSTIWLHDSYHLNAQVGDYWATDSIHHIGGWWGVSAIFDTGVFLARKKVKTFENFLGFYGDTSGGQDHNPVHWGGTLWEDYAYGIGMTYRTVEPGEGWFLIGAIINGDSMGTILGVNERKDKLPENFTLFQNYPNPFNPSTAIRYELSGVSEVTIKVYDVLGREVKTLVEERETAGHHVVYWDGTDRYGRRVASGVYYYRLTTPGGSITRKAVLVR